MSAANSRCLHRFDELLNGAPRPEPVKFLDRQQPELLVRAVSALLALSLGKNLKQFVTRRKTAVDDIGSSGTPLDSLTRKLMR